MTQTSQEEALEAVERIQKIDPTSIARESALGPFAFRDAVKPLERLVDLFVQIPLGHIKDLPDQQANQLRDQANAISDRVKELDEFDPKVEENPSAKQQSLTDALVNAYPSTFSHLWNHIAYLASRERDFGALETEAKGMLQTVRTETNSLKSEMEQQKAAADEILSDIKKAAAETGVSQQAIHFSNESVAQAGEADKWEKRTGWAFVAIVIFGILTLFMHKWDWIAPVTTYETIQLAVSKALIFIALFYVLTLCARNYLAHKHGQAVNKHRQNALATYQAIADAAHDEAGRDIVLSHAADCIFSPQETGYLAMKRGDSSDTAPTLQVLPRVASGSDS